VRGAWFREGSRRQDNHPPRSTRTFPTSINAAGVITGWFTYAHSEEHGFLRSPD
jgi:hypothetical protein